VTALNSIRDPWLEHFDSHEKKVESDPISYNSASAIERGEWMEAALPHRAK
jgi:hypothetical protein